MNGWSKCIIFVCHCVRIFYVRASVNLLSGINLTCFFYFLFQAKRRDRYTAERLQCLVKTKGIEGNCFGVDENRFIPTVNVGDCPLAKAVSM